ncbi:IctB family putative bicarbonate transporter [Spirulina subsalsa]|uniref:IctB family putative bicarbonate transporter n=1 Tax=Spirulina subsalsa TaxID=54311 RepID=UPI0002E7E1E1|nr:IctB family putative bicarbonate transporter [Spirulina subsalsa]
MNSVWQRFTLSDLPLSQWRGGSYLYRLVGFLSAWREGSWFLQWANPLGAVILCAIVLIAPFTNSSNPTGVLLIAAGGYWLMLTLSDRLKTGSTPIHLAVGVYWCIAVIATAFSDVKSAAFSGLIKLTLFLFMFLLGAQVLRSPRLRNWVVAVYLHVSLLVSAYGIRQQYKGVEQLATWNDPTSLLAHETRVYSFLGNPNLLAGYLITAIALSIAALFVWRGYLPKTLAGVMLVINLACLFFTDSRGGWIAALALLITFFLLLRYWFAEYLPTVWRMWLVPMLFGGMTGAILLGITLVEPLRLRVMSIFAGREDSSNNFRINVWEAVFRMIGDHPIIGIGPGNDAFKQVYPLYARSGYGDALGAYSIFLETLVEVGWVGFALFLWFGLITFNLGLQQLARLRQTKEVQAFWLMAAIAACAGMLVHGLFDTVWYRPPINTLWWLMVALIASFFASGQPSNSAPVE